MYCARCRQLKDDAEGVASPILRYELAGDPAPLCELFLGDEVAAAAFKGERICVHEATPKYGGIFWHVPILIVPPKSKLDRSGAIAGEGRLDWVGRIIDTQLALGKRVLVHCHGGVERSPLALCWWLWKSGRQPSLESALACLKEKRPVVANRLSWLP